MAIIENSEVAELKSRVQFLEQKLVFFRKHAEALIAQSDASPLSRGTEFIQMENLRLRDRVRELEADLAKVRRSVSWRITAPIRKIKLPGEK